MSLRQDDGDTPLWQSRAEQSMRREEKELDLR